MSSFGICPPEKLNQLGIPSPKRIYSGKRAHFNAVLRAQNEFPPPVLYATPPLRTPDKCLMSPTLTHLLSLYNIYVLMSFPKDMMRICLHFICQFLCFLPHISKNLNLLKTQPRNKLQKSKPK